MARVKKVGGSQEMAGWWVYGKNFHNNNSGEICTDS